MKSLTKAMQIPAGLDSAVNKYTIMYECPTGIESKFITLFISNLEGNNKSISIALYRPSANNYVHFLDNTVINANNYIHIWGGYVVLEPGDQIRVTKTAVGSHFTVICTLEEEKKTTQSNSGSTPYNVGI